jgi:hypothetical protein
MHAAGDRSAAQVVMAMAMRRRCAFIGYLLVSLVAASSKLDGHLAAEIAAMSRFCDSGRSSSTVRHRKPDADHCALTVAAANRDLPAVTDDNDTDQGEPIPVPGTPGGFSG